ncbi:MAG: S-adenosylmethionine decarboxylase [Candidatus Uhrbacteria bacterium]
MHTTRYHLIVDVSSANESISNPDAIRAFLHDMAAATDMSVLAGPLVAEGIPENPGITGFVIVDFSHVSVHTFTKYGEAMIDVFSCKPYDQEKVRALCRRTFGTEGSEVREKLVWWGE